MKTVLFVPGFKENKQSRNYDATMKAIESCGYKVKFVPISWNRTPTVDWIDELDKVYRNFDSVQTILAGFSYGAMTAFMTATKRNPSELWLFSLSPYFAEDLKSKNMRDTWLKGIGKHRVVDFSALSFESLAKSVNCKTLLFAGQLEIDKWPVIGERAKDAHSLLRNNKLVIIPEVGHDVADLKYIEAISGNI